VIDKDKTLRKGLQILDLLSASDGPRGAADVARQLDMTRSNAFRLIGTLADMGYLRRADETGRYEPTLKSWEIGMRIMARNPLRRVAQPALRALHAATGFNVYLAMLDGADILYLDKVETEIRSHVSAQPGMRLPAFLVASGHAILASQPDDVAIDMLAGHPRASETTQDALAAALDRARDTGWAMTLSGSRPGVTSIAASIAPPGEPALAAIALSAPTGELPAARHEDIARQVMMHAMSIADLL
jgi:DNA-binding IclR family transcriptional regulator